MNKRSSALARVVAVATLVVALIVVIVVIAGAFGDDSDDSAGQGHGKAHHASEPKRSTPATYEVKSGDTLISIAHRNGVTVARIEALNPEVDPQILIAGETLKLK